MRRGVVLRQNHALLFHEPVAAPLLRGHGEGEVARGYADVELHSHAEVCGVAAGPAPDLVDPAPVAQRMIQPSARSESATNPIASRKLLFPEPFGPTRNVSCAGDTSHAAILL